MNVQAILGGFISILLAGGLVRLLAFSLKIKLGDNSPFFVQVGFLILFFLLMILFFYFYSLLFQIKND